MAIPRACAKPEPRHRSGIRYRQVFFVPRRHNALTSWASRTLPCWPMTMSSPASFYGEFLGFQEPYSLKNPDGSALMTFFKINDRQYVELFPERAANTDRLSHISLETDDIEGLRVYLASKGVKVPAEPHRARIGLTSASILPIQKATRWRWFSTCPKARLFRPKGKFMSDDRGSQRE